MNIVIIGKNGQLGYEVFRQLDRKRHKITVFDLPEFDITKKNKVFEQLPADCELVINSSAFTNVDLAEDKIKEAFAVNSEGAEILARFCSEKNIPLIHISTDYVFDGRTKGLYSEKSNVNPINVYGKSKLAGEVAINKILNKNIIIRTSWLFGVHGANFVKTIIRLAHTEETLKVINDQFGCPTFAKDLASVIICIIKEIDNLSSEFTSWGLYNYCGSTTISWYEFSKLIIERAHKYSELKTKKIIPVTSEEFSSKAERPKFSALDTGLICKTFGIKPRSIEDTLTEMIDELMVIVP